MPFWVVHILDDRGRRVKLISFGAHAGRDDAELGRTLARLADQVHETASGGLELAVATVAATVVALISAGLGVWIDLRWLLWIGVGIGAFLACAILGHAKKTRHARRIASALLEIGRCPSCGYHLRGASVDEDKRMVCPECSAAWQQARVQFAMARPAELAYSRELVSMSSPVHVLLRIWLRFPRLPDARNRMVAVLGPGLETLDSQIGDQRAAELREVVANATRPTRLGGTITAIVLGAGLIGTQVWGLVYGKPGTLGEANLWFAIGVGILATVMAWRSWTGRSPGVARRTVALLTSERICPSCGADLRECSREDDGRTVCPRCRCAWRIAP